MMSDAQYSAARLVALYDRVNAADHDQVFYEAIIGKQPMRVLDLGCGTGLFARRLARRGHRVTGLDPAAGMVEWARAQDGAERIDWHVGTVGDLPQAAGFDVVVMTGHAFQCLATEDAVRSTMAAVRVRLAPGGRFMFESRNPEARAWETWTPDDVDVVQDATGGQVRVFTEVLAVADRRVTFRNHFAFPDAELLSDSTLLFLPQADIRRHLSDAGFSIVEVFGDWTGSPITSRSPEIIVIAQ
jgi:ubiquinone/menaquinone biosynthesis C-methylase UbiE